MDEVVSKGALSLLEFGILGVFCLLFLGAIVYLNQQGRKTQDKLLSVKDGQIKDLQETVRTHVANQDKTIQEMGTNVTRLLDLYERLYKDVSEIREKVIFRKSD